MSDAMKLREQITKESTKLEALIAKKKQCTVNLTKLLDDDSVTAEQKLANLNEKIEKLKNDIQREKSRYENIR